MLLYTFVSVEKLVAIGQQVLKERKGNIDDTRLVIYLSKECFAEFCL